MKKIIILAALALASFAASAQDLKIGYVNFNEIVMLMPEMDSVTVQLEAQQKEATETLRAMYDEYQTKGQQFEQKQASWTPAIRDAKMRELQEIENRIRESEQIFQQEIQQMQQMLQAPVLEKAQSIVSGLAKGKGLALVLNQQDMLYFDPVFLVDLTPDARLALNIPEGRTLETLQAELQAKAQAQQAQMQ